jgi:hypothetical protein
MSATNRITHYIELLSNGRMNITDFQTRGLVPDERESTERDEKFG